MNTHYLEGAPVASPDRDLEFTDLRKLVTIIIPTLCTLEREARLERALRSLCNQQAGVPRILLVANGSCVNHEMLGRLRDCFGAETMMITEASQVRAIREGRARIDTPYFGFLDDDDEYLPQALALRLRALGENPAVAAAVTDGLYEEGGREEPRDVATIEAGRDPLRALTRKNWLASCGATFRSSLVTVDFFDNLTHYFEWTVIAYRIASRFPVALVPELGYRIHSLPGSLSKSEAYRMAEPEALEAIAKLPLPADVRNAVLRRRADAYHSISSYFLGAGRPGRAWRAHLASLAHPGGARYLTYTIRLLLGARNPPRRQSP
jgi:glycosyltransferase involved in cell wall biosynthesis